MKVARTVWSGGKLGDYFKELPITIAGIKIRRRKVTGKKKFYGRQLSIKIGKKMT